MGHRQLVDQTTIGPLASGQTFTANYSVTVDTTGSTNSKWADSGSITITNNHPTLAADLTGGGLNTRRPFSIPVIGAPGGHTPPRGIGIA